MHKNEGFVNLKSQLEVCISDLFRKKNLQHLDLSCFCTENEKWGCLNKIEVGLNKAKLVGSREMHCCMGVIQKTEHFIFMNHLLI